MSYEISYRRQAFVMPAARAGHYDDLVFLVEEMGSNNCWEIGNRRRARSWECVAAGPEWDCLAEVTRCAAACCGGSLCLYGRRRTKPESYIRAWRKALAEAAPVLDANRLGFRLQLLRRITQAEAADGCKYAFDQLSKQTLVTPGQYTDAYNDKTAMEWRFDLAVPEQVKLWLDTRGSGRAWRTVEASGPEW